jgi:hypothetical protein
MRNIELFEPLGWTPQVAMQPARALSGFGRVCADPVEFCREWLGFEPDPRQCELLRAPVHRTIWNCGRQLGKSTMAGVLALQRGLARPGSMILVASPCGRQSAEFLRKVRGMMQRMGLRIQGDGDNEMSLVLPGESRIVGIPGREDTVRGFSAVDFMILEEASRIPEALYHALRPMLAATNGDLLMISTPFGKQGIFFREWSRPGDTWTKFLVKTEESPRISREFLKEEREVLGEEFYAQEYECVFTASAHGVFDVEALLAGVAKGVKAWEL